MNKSDSGLFVASLPLCAVVFATLVMVVLVAATAIFVAQRAAAAYGETAAPETATSFADAVFLAVSTSTTLGVLPRANFTMTASARAIVATLSVIGPPLFLFATLEALWTLAVTLHSPLALEWRAVVPMTNEQL
jgi:hypothetical protein